jgi:hypothetical protein
LWLYPGSCLVTVRAGQGGRGRRCPFRCRRMLVGKPAASRRSCLHQAKHMPDQTHPLPMVRVVPTPDGTRPSAPAPMRSARRRPSRPVVLMRIAPAPARGWRCQIGGEPDAKTAAVLRRSPGAMASDRRESAMPKARDTPAPPTRCARWRWHPRSAVNVCPVGLPRDPPPPSASAGASRRIRGSGPRPQAARAASSRSSRRHRSRAHAMRTRR